MVFRVIEKIHWLIKKILQRNIADYNGRYFSVSRSGYYIIKKIDASKAAYLNEKKILESYLNISSEHLFYGENTGANIEIEFGCIQSSIRKDIASVNRTTTAESSWADCINSSIVPTGFRNSGFCINGYILEEKRYCLSSWIWTSAAVARCLVRMRDIARAELIAEAFLREQKDCGGWIVRFDFSAHEVWPILAPNDSAYIANNCLLRLYEVTKKNEYLRAAEKCAEWIIKYSREDGLVSNGYNLAKSCWEQDNIIVDTGFTADLFASLYIITKKKEYIDFLEKFTHAFIVQFFDPKHSLFSTSIDRKGNRQGGFFSRGQAWALEGLIGAYEILQNLELFELIEKCINGIIDGQNRDGSWPYNISRRYMGKDCKGTSVIGLVLIRWYRYSNHKRDILISCKAAENWCEKNTALSGPETGMIFSYSFEGAVVHSPYTTTAFVYASAYALELKKELESIYDTTKQQ